MPRNRGVYTKPKSKFDSLVEQVINYNRLWNKSKPKHLHRSTNSKKVRRLIRQQIASEEYFV